MNLFGWGPGGCVMGRCGFRCCQSTCLHGWNQHKAVHLSITTLHVWSFIHAISACSRFRHTKKHRACLHLLERAPRTAHKRTALVIPERMISTWNKHTMKKTHRPTSRPSHLVSSPSRVSSLCLPGRVESQVVKFATRVDSSPSPYDSSPIVW